MTAKVCKKCKSQIRPLEINPGKRSAHLVCPVCKSKIGNYVEEGRLYVFLILALLILLFWLTK
jgi:hypothetical protein